MNRRFELDEFQVQAVTEGREAMGDAIVKIRYNGKLYSGRGLSTDIVGASIRRISPPSTKSSMRNRAYEASYLRETGRDSAGKAL